MTNLEKILARCKCGVYITMNDHRTEYISAKECLEVRSSFEGEHIKNIPKEVLAKMIELNTIVEVQVYPDTPIGSHTEFHYDLDKALDEILICLGLNKD